MSAALLPVTPSDESQYVRVSRQGLLALHDLLTPVESTANIDEPSYVRFTRRELSVLRELMKAGEPNDVIADRLFISLDTVKSHVRNILGKTEAANRTELALRLLRQEIIPTDPTGRVIRVE